MSCCSYPELYSYSPRAIAEEAPRTAVEAFTDTNTTGSLLFLVPNPMALCQNHCALRNGSFVSLQASLLKGIHLIQKAGHAGFETIFRVWPLLI